MSRGPGSEAGEIARLTARVAELEAELRRQAERERAKRRTLSQANALLDHQLFEARIGHRVMDVAEATRGELAPLAEGLFDLLAELLPLSAVGLLLSRGEPPRLLARGTEAHPDFLAALREGRPRETDTCALVPLVASGAPFGTLGACFSEPLGGQDREVLAAFAGLAAGFIERALLMQRLLELADYKRDFVNMLTHDLRNPLTGVISALSTLLLLGPTWPETERERWTRSAMTAARQLNAMLDDLLDVAKLEAGRYEPGRELVDLAEVLEQALVPARAVASLRGLALKVDLPEAGPWTRGESSKLLRIAANLMGNAVKYTSRGGVLVALDADAERVRLRVADTGLGIPASARAGLFEQFYRATPKDPERPGGTGLGLAFCRQMVEAHGGRIALESPSSLAAEALGVSAEAPGSLFTVWLPAASPPSPASGA